jgi:hypothetical protein
MPASVKQVQGFRAETGLSRWEGTNLPRLSAC